MYGSGDEARHQLAADLEAAGHQSGIGFDGLYARGPEFEAIISGLDHAFSQLVAGNEKVIRYTFPPLLPAWVFAKTDYLASFPQLTGSVNVFTGNDAGHKALLKVYEEGGDWAADLVPSGLFEVPATCHNIYPRYQDTVLDEPVLIEARSWCFRHEPSIDPMRMVCFRINEDVYMGTADGAQQHRDQVLEQFRGLADQLDLPVSVDVANDPFFGRAGRILAVGQRDEALKFEILADVFADKPTAIASGNAHRTHFGENFNITLSDGSVAHSSCGGIGMERFTIALLAQHGMSTKDWPAGVRSALGL